MGIRDLPCQYGCDRTRLPSFDGTEVIKHPFELPEACGVRRTLSIDAHKLTAVVIVKPQEFLATAVLSSSLRLDDVGRCSL